MTGAQARPLVEPLISLLAAAIAESRAQTSRYEQLRDLLGAGGSGTLGLPGVGQALDDKLAELDAGVTRLGQFERDRRVRAAELRAEMARYARSEPKGTT